MAITTIDDLKTRVTELVPPGEPITETAVRTIHKELTDGGSQLTLEDISYGLRDAYINPFLSIKYVNEQLTKYNLTYENS
jgi:hypothetical protein